MYFQFPIIIQTLYTVGVMTKVYLVNLNNQKGFEKYRKDSGIDIEVGNASNLSIKEEYGNDYQTKPQTLKDLKKNLQDLNAENEKLRQQLIELTKKKKKSLQENLQASLDENKELRKKLSRLTAPKQHNLDKKSKQIQTSSKTKQTDKKLG